MIRCLLTLVLLCGCLHPGASGPASDAGVPAHLLGTVEPRRFPASAFITHAGSGASAEQAESAAKAGVAEQVLARLESEFTSVESQEVVGDRVASEESRRRRVSVRASFDHAELVRIVERRQAGGVHYALAALDRDEASRVLQADYTAAAVPLRTLVDSAVASSKDLRSFAAAWSRARPFARKVASAGGAWAVVSGQRPAALDADLKRIDDLEAARTHLLQSSAVRVLGASGPAAQATAVVGRALTSLGLPLVATGDGRPALDLHVDVEESFPRGVGVCCVWRLSVRVDGASRPLGLEPMACDLRDRNVAREQLLRSLGPDTLAGPLRAALGSVLPVEE